MKATFRWKENAVFAEGYSLEKAEEDWREGREGYAVYSTASAGSTYVYYKNVPNTELILTFLMRESNINVVIEDATQSILHFSTVYLFIVIISLLCLFWMIIRIIQNARKHQSENDQLKIAGALSNDYSDVFLVEPLRDITSTMKVNGQMIKPEKRVVRSYREAFNNYVKK